MIKPADADVIGAADLLAVIVEEGTAEHGLALLEGDVEHGSRIGLGHFFSAIELTDAQPCLHNGKGLARGKPVVPEHGVPGGHRAADGGIRLLRP
ncbi:MAG: hypothetical protein ACK55I_46290, partial [bacterium]